jgi:anti-sigma B factor antagonist
MKVTTSDAGSGAVLLEVEGAVDAYTAPRLDKALRDLLARDQIRLVLDAQQLTFISSAGLRVILFAHREAIQHGGEVRVFGLNPQLQRVFEIAGFYRLLRISETLQEAVECW